MAYITESKSEAVEKTSITTVKIKDDFSGDNIEKHGKSVKITNKNIAFSKSIRYTVVIGSKRVAKWSKMEWR